MSHTVLVVEDDVDIRQALLEILEDHGFTAVGASDGAEALDILARAPELPCVILLDLMMPVMDGQEFFYRLGQLGKSNIPVIILSNSQEAAYPNQIATYLIKSETSLEKIVATVREYLP